MALAEQFPAAIFRDSVRELIQRELELEDESILHPLARRLELIAEALDRGQAIDPTDVSQGIALLSRYDREVHGPRVRQLLALLPPTSLTADADGPRDDWPAVFHRKRVRRVESEEGLAAEYEGIVHGERAARSRVSALTTFVEAYRAGGWKSPERLASVLKGYLVADRVWARAEREYVLRALTVSLPPMLEKEARAAVATIAAARNALRGDVRRYAERPIAVRAIDAAEEPPAVR